MKIISSTSLTNIGKTAESKLSLTFLLGVFCINACVPFSTEIPAPASSAVNPPVSIESTASSANALPTATTTLFAEHVNTREPGVLLTPTTIFPTVTPIAIGQRLWSKGNPMPTQRSELSSALLGGKIYVAGGTHVKGLTYARMEVYDPQTDAWSTVAPMPIGRHHFGMAALNGKIYISGGLPDWYRETETCFVYDPAADAWSQIASMPYRIATHSMAALDGKLYVVGGNQTPVSGGAMPMFVYDPATDRWDQSHAPLPSGREHLAVVSAEGKLFVIGGRYNQDTNRAIIEIYDPQTDSWTRGPDMLTPASGLTAAYLDGRIHVTGGEDLFHNTVSSQHQVLDLATMTWEEWPGLPGARHGLTSQAVDGKWVVIGGSPIPNIGMSNRVDIFIP